MTSKAAPMASLSNQLLDKFLEPMQIDTDKSHALVDAFYQNFTKLAAEVSGQFLPTPISDSILRPIAGTGRGR
jgi:hypothetical protein